MRYPLSKSSWLLRANIISLCQQAARESTSLKSKLEEWEGRKENRAGGWWVARLNHELRERKNRLEQLQPTSYFWPPIPPIWESLILFLSLISQYLQLPHSLFIWSNYHEDYFELPPFYFCTIYFQRLYFKLLYILLLARQQIKCWNNKTKMHTLSCSVNPLSCLLWTWPYHPQNLLTVSRMIPQLWAISKRTIIMVSLKILVQVVVLMNSFPVSSTRLINALYCIHTNF